MGREAAGPDGQRESLLDMDFGLCVSSSENVGESCLVWTQSSGHGGRGPAPTEGLLQTEEVFPSGIRLQMLPQGLWGRRSRPSGTLLLGRRGPGCRPPGRRRAGSAQLPLPQAGSPGSAFSPPDDLGWFYRSPAHIQAIIRPSSFLEPRGETPSGSLFPPRGRPGSFQRLPGHPLCAAATVGRARPPRPRGPLVS